MGSPPWPCLSGALLLAIPGSIDLADIAGYTAASEVEEVPLRLDGQPTVASEQPCPAGHFD